MMYQDFSAKPLAQQEEERRNAAEQAAELISRYPNLSQAERAKAIRLYRALSALDMALMISDEELAPKLDQFYKDNWRKLRVPFRQYAVLAVIAASGFALAIWAGIVGLL